MRMTVGPLPPAVYWRRRVVVLGAGLLFLIVLLYSCNGPEPNTGATPRSASSPASSAPSANSQPSGPVLTPQTDDPSAAPDDSGGGSSGGPAGGGTVDAPAAPAAPVVDDGTCTDAEILVTPVAQPATAQRGTVVNLQLKIKNKSQRTCSRNVGADLQELFIKSGAEKIWSSDTCGTGKGSDVQSFTPGFERLYELGWNGREANRCANGLANGDYAPIGSYPVFARVGTKLSEPVKLTITG
jgi:cytoskeletal protein RodZ